MGVTVNTDTQEAQLTVNCPGEKMVPSIIFVRVFLMKLQICQVAVEVFQQIAYLNLCVSDKGLYV